MSLKITTVGMISLLFSVNCHAQSYTKSDTEKAGDVLKNLIPLTAFSAAVFYEKGSEGPIQFAKSFVTAKLLTKSLKTITDKERPNGSCCDSFPSGHATSAFMGASFIQKRYGWKYSIPAYAGASYVAYSRVEADKHYWEDVVAGAAVGILSSYYFTDPYKDITITPIVSRDFIGVSFVANW